MFQIKYPQTQLQLFHMLLSLAGDERVFYAGVVFAYFTHWLLLNIEFVQKKNFLPELWSGASTEGRRTAANYPLLACAKNKKPTSSLIVCNCCFFF